MKRKLPKILLIAITVILILISVYIARIETFPTDKMIACLENSVYSSNNSCLISKRAMYFELLSRKEENEEIAQLIAEMFYYSLEQNDYYGEFADGVLLLDGNAQSAIPLLVNSINDSVDTVQETSNQFQLKYELFALGMIGEEASCGMEAVMRVAETESGYGPPDYVRNLTLEAQKNLAYWAVKQMLGVQRSFELPSDQYVSGYADWFSCTIPIIGNQTKCDQYKNDELLSAAPKELFWVYHAVRAIKNQKRIEYYYFYLPEDNQFIQEWWETEGQFSDWGTCNP